MIKIFFCIHGQHKLIKVKSISLKLIRTPTCRISKVFLPYASKRTPAPDMRAIRQPRIGKLWSVRLLVRLRGTAERLRARSYASILLFLVNVVTSAMDINVCESLLSFLISRFSVNYVKSYYL